MMAVSPGRKRFQIRGYHRSGFPIAASLYASLFSWLSFVLVSKMVMACPCPCETQGTGLSWGINTTIIIRYSAASQRKLQSAYHSSSLNKQLITIGFIDTYLTLRFVRCNCIFIPSSSNGSNLTLGYRLVQ
jgi:hypothetical protein